MLQLKDKAGGYAVFAREASFSFVRMSYEPQIFADVNEHTPCVFVLSPGADPMALLKKYATSVGMESNLDVVSLGKGQGHRAEEVIKVKWTGSFAGVVVRAFGTGSKKCRVDTSVASWEFGIRAAPGNLQAFATELSLIYFVSFGVSHAQRCCIPPRVKSGTYSIE